MSACHKELTQKATPEHILSSFLLNFMPMKTLQL